MTSNIRRIASLLAFAVALIAGSGDTASAQYFGRNKVQYKKLNFQVMKTENFDIYFYPEEKEGVEIAARMAERWRTRLGRLFNHELSGRQTLILYASHPDFEGTNTTPSELGEGTGGFTESARRRIVLPLGGPLADTDHVIGHELVHAFQFDITSRPGAGGMTGAQLLPLWFIEGMAEYFSIGPVDSNTTMWLRDAVAHENDRSGLPALKDLDNPKYFPYRWGHAFWAYVGGKWGDGAIAEMLDIAGATGDIELALVRTLGIGSDEFSDEWRAAIRRSYQTSIPESENIGPVVVRSGGTGTTLNIGPAISPDGRWIAFLSERSLMSIDLFVADAETGKVRRKLTSTATDSHLSSIQFIISAGAWAPDSERIAIAGVASGRAALMIYNGARGGKEQDYKLQLDEIFNPTWAPDGSAVAFTGMSGGLTDLYVLDLKTGAVRPLMRDPYADLQPTWSPDGTTIAFATDRYSTNLETLNIGSYRIALVNVQTGDIRQLSAFTDGKNINPQWTPDGTNLLFISDRDGVPNLYRVNVTTGAVAQLTEAVTGLSGITGTSPALSVATKTGVAAFSVYTNGGYSIHKLPLGTSASDASLNARVDLSPVSTTAAVLPPLDRGSSDVYALLTNPTIGLPPIQENDIEEYKPKIALEGIGQPEIAVGVSSRFGPALAGGISFAFADMLGDQRIDATVQFGSNLTGNFSMKDTAAIVSYINQRNRWHWGFAGSQIPYSSGGINQSIGAINGQPAFVDETITLRQTERSALGLLAYPLSRAQRVEFQGGFTQLSFDQVVRTRGYDLVSGDKFYDETETTPYGETLNMATATTALVFDTSSFGATSPISGQRYRIEGSPTFGTVNYMGFLADYRRYFMPVSYYTIASRVLHYGRYGNGSEDPRLVPLYIGYPFFVRGYDANTFDATDCLGSLGCPIFDRLEGSRMLVGNLEFRFPLLRPFVGVSPAMYGPVPVEVALFADAGVTWGRNTRPAILGGDREGVTSVGAAIRVNLLGFAVGEFDWARPLQRDNRGWIFQFNLMPGF